MSINPDEGAFKGIPEGDIDRGDEENIELREILRPDDIPGSDTDPQASGIEATETEATETDTTLSQPEWLQRLLEKKGDDTTLSQGERLKRSKVVSFYKHLEVGLKMVPKLDAMPYDEFKRDNNQLFFDGIRLTREDNAEFRIIGPALLRVLRPKNRLGRMGFEGYIKPIAATAGRLLNDVEQIKANGDTIEMEPLLGKVIDETKSFIEDTSFGGGEILTDRERRGLDLGIGTIRGQMRMLESKILVRDEQIKSLEDKKKANPGATKEQIDIWNKELEKLRDEKKALREQHGVFSSEIQSQLTIIKETLMKIAGDDTSLLEKLKILFKEQGLTIASIVSAVGLLVSTIVLAVTGGGGGAAGGSAAGGGKGFVQKQLERLGKILKYLAGKAAAALPGIIGSVVSFFFRVAARVVEFAAQHLYMTAAAAVVAVVVTYIGKGKKA